MDQGAQGLADDSVISDSTQALQIVGSQQMEMDQPGVAQLGSIPSVVVELVGGEVSPSAKKMEPIGAKSNKMGVHLGLH